ncbi:hypothetical protein MF271_19030 (plasmid) [Deinococcus sp. KNUC1210]|uniref:hypothetical protein n=1 Tax=Deinococcus sp. KNUC1210 TaxID=2917691 RepID=UPI001EEF9C24|nr:hypothetical protein [Deinococcus sp. KNUC1210]ULH17415.1 hypothetical protein MF271_19030 [Deinococcus sp. KNUC1210]
MIMISEHDLLQPALFDRLLNSSNQFRELLDQLSNATPEGRARRGQCALATGDSALMIEMLTALHADRLPLAQAVSLSIKAMLGEHEAVLAADTFTLNSDLLVLEAGCHAHAARAVSLAQTGENESALWELASAITLAQTVGLSHRIQMLEFERERIMSLRGKARPEELQRLLIAPMPIRRRAFGQRNLAEAWMSYGSYRNALHALGTPNHEDTATTALREFLYAVLGLPSLIPSDELLSLGYVQLAQAVRALRHIHEIGSLAAVTGEPKSTYARIFRAFSLLRRSPQAEGALELLGPERPAQPDQAALFALAQLAAYIAGDARVRVVDALAAFEQALDQMPEHRPFFFFVRQVFPEMYILLLKSPLGHTYPREDLDSVPLLAGNHIAWNGTTLELPGTTGLILIKEAVTQVGVDPTMAATEAYYTALEDAAILPSAVVNLGWVARACIRLVEAYRGAHLPQHVIAWKSAHAAVSSEMTSDVQDVLRMYP